MDLAVGVAGAGVEVAAGVGLESGVEVAPALGPAEAVAIGLAEGPLRMNAPLGSLPVLVKGRKGGLFACTYDGPATAPGGTANRISVSQFAAASHAVSLYVPFGGVDDPPRMDTCATTET